MRHVSLSAVLVVFALSSCGASEQDAQRETDLVQQELVGGVVGRYRIKNNATGRCVQSNGGLGSCATAATYTVYSNGGYYNICNTSLCLNLQSRAPYFWVGLAGC